MVKTTLILLSGLASFPAHTREPGNEGMSGLVICTDFTQKTNGWRKLIPLCESACGIRTTDLSKLLLPKK